MTTNTQKKKSLIMRLLDKLREFFVGHKKQNQEEELSAEDLNTMYRPKISKERMKNFHNKMKEMGYLENEDN